jgi:hypothetical protein
LLLRLAIRSQLVIGTLGIQTLHELLKLRAVVLAVEKAAIGGTLDAVLATAFLDIVEGWPAAGVLDAADCLRDVARVG